MTQMIRIAEPLPNDDGPYESRGRFDAELHTARQYARPWTPTATARSTRVK